MPASMQRRCGGRESKRLHLLDPRCTPGDSRAHLCVLLGTHGAQQGTVGEYFLRCEIDATVRAVSPKTVARIHFSFVHRRTPSRSPRSWPTQQQQRSVASTHGSAAPLFPARHAAVGHHAMRRCDRLRGDDVGARAAEQERGLESTGCHDGVGLSKPTAATRAPADRRCVTAAAVCAALPLCSRTMVPRVRRVTQRRRRITRRRISICCCRASKRS